MRAYGKLGAFIVERERADLQTPSALLPVTDFARRHRRQVIQIGPLRHAARENYAFSNDLSLVQFAQSVVNLNCAGFEDLAHGLQNLFARRVDDVRVIERPLGLRPVELYLRARVERTESDKQKRKTYVKRFQVHNAQSNFKNCGRNG